MTHRFLCVKTVHSKHNNQPHLLCIILCVCCTLYTLLIGYGPTVTTHSQEATIPTTTAMGKGQLKDTVRVFDGHNYHNWKEQVQMYIAMQGLSYLLEPQPHRLSPHLPLNISTTEKDKQPASSSSSGDRETREEREREERYASEVRKHEKWNDENKQLVGAIYFCVSVSYRMVVKECTTVLEIFTKFDEMFLKQDKMQKLMHKEQFMQFKFDEAREINAQFMRYEELLERNIALG